jgi:chondroitin sulfate proteoglycan 4
MVSDGDSYVSGDLEIRASPPFIEVVNNSGLIVQRGAAVALTPANLSAETNVNARSNQLKYDITEAPAHGMIELDGEHTKVFSEHDLEQGGVVYRHDGGNALKVRYHLNILSLTSLFYRVENVILY